MHPLQLGWKLLLGQEDWRDGSLDLMSQHADQGENDGSWKAMKFFRAVADSNGPQFEYNTRFPNAGDRRTIPVCPTIKKRALKTNDASPRSKNGYNNAQKRIRYVAARSTTVQTCHYLHVYSIFEMVCG
jgi:hypothetical protein